MISASGITSAQFKEALGRYPALIQKLSDNEKSMPSTLLQLDQYRYIDAPAAFSKQTGRTIKLADLQKLLEWKLRHGKWRPSLTNLVASNRDEIVATSTEKAFKFHANNPTKVSETLKILAGPLKGVGPATGSLLLSVHDPQQVLFFSDEAFRWLVNSGNKKSITYSIKEYEQLSIKCQDLMKKLDVTPQEVEKVAYVIIKENEPVYEPAPKHVPSGRPPGRPKKPDSEKKVKVLSVPGRGRGRPRKADSAGKADKPASTARPGRQAESGDADGQQPKVPGRGRGRPTKSAGSATKNLKRGADDDEPEEHVDKKAKQEKSKK